jgi:ferredoxin-type protein NapH
LLAFIGSRRSLKIHHDQETCTDCGVCRCSCPLGLDPALKEGALPYCWNCGECVEACRPGALCLRWKARRSPVL